MAGQSQLTDQAQCCPQSYIDLRIRFGGEGFQIRGKSPLLGSGICDDQRENSPDQPEIDRSDNLVVSLGFSPS